ncbi:MAG: hypothetical protein ACYSUI_09015, partial [Planctomycetota bacterium]
QPSWGIKRRRTVTSIEFLGGREERGAEGIVEQQSGVLRFELEDEELSDLRESLDYINRGHFSQGPEFHDVVTRKGGKEWTVYLITPDDPAYDR